MKDLLDQIRTKLIALGFTVESEGHVAEGFSRWYVESPADETCVYVLVSEDMNHHPQFWCQCPDSISNKYTTPINVMIGDAREEIMAAHVAQRASRGSNAL